MRQRNHTSRGMVHGRLVVAGLAIGLTVLLSPVHLPAQPPASSQRVLAAQELLEVEAKIREIEQAALQADPDYTTAVERLADAESAWSEHRAAFEARRNADPEYQSLLSRIEKLRQDNDAKQQAAIQARLDHQSAEREYRKVIDTINKVQESMNEHKEEIERTLKQKEVIAKEAGARHGGGVGIGMDYRSMSDINKEFNRILQQQRSVRLGNNKLSLAEAEKQRRRAEAEAKAAQQALINANQKLQTVEARWESLFESDPRTMRLKMALEQAQQQADTAKEKVLSSIHDPAYRNLLTRREELKQELGPS